MKRRPGREGIQEGLSDSFTLQRDCGYPQSPATDVKLEHVQLVFLLPSFAVKTRQAYAQ